jgi:hypothetical protein
MYLAFPIRLLAVLVEPLWQIGITEIFVNALFLSSGK